MRSLQSRERAQPNDTAEVISKLEGEIRELVSGATTVSALPRRTDNELAANSISSMLSGVSETSLQEIENRIGELQTLRELNNAACNIRTGSTMVIQLPKKVAKTAQNSILGSMSSPIECSHDARCCRS
jgi:hypothetical protein